jgi:hypothetical protein
LSAVPALPGLWHPISPGILAKLRTAIVISAEYRQTWLKQNLHCLPSTSRWQWSPQSDKELIAAVQLWCSEQASHPPTATQSAASWVALNTHFTAPPASAAKPTAVEVLQRVKRLRNLGRLGLALAGDEEVAHGPAYDHTAAHGCTACVTTTLTYAALDGPAAHAHAAYGSAAHGCTACVTTTLTHAALDPAAQAPAAHGPTAPRRTATVASVPAAALGLATHAPASRASSAASSPPERRGRAPSLTPAMPEYWFCAVVGCTDNFASLCEIGSCRAELCNRHQACPFPH